MPWQLTVLIHSLLSGSRSIQNRIIGTNKQDVSAYALLASLFSVFILGVVLVLIRGGEVNHSAAWSARYFLIAGGLLFALINLLNLKLFRLVPASFAILMSILNPVAVLIIASYFAGESLSTKQLLGATILLFSVLLIGYLSRRKEKAKVRRSVALGLLISFMIATLFGLAIINEKYLLDRLFLDTYLVYGWGMQFISALFVYFILNGSVSGLDKKIHRQVWTYGVILAFSGLFFVLTLVNSDSSSLTSVSSSFNIVVTMVLAYILLKERQHPIAKVSGVMLSSVGLYFLFS